MVAFMKLPKKDLDFVTVTLFRRVAA